MSRSHSRSPPLPSHSQSPSAPSATSSPTDTTTSLRDMNVNYAPAPSSFPSTTDAWMGSRPTVSPLKTADDAYSRSSSSSFYASTNLAPSPPPSLHQSTPRGQWLASHDSGRRASYGQYPPSQQYPSPGPLGSPQEDHWSPNGHHAHSPGYLPQTQSYQQYHPSQPQQPAAYPAAVPLNQSVHIGSVPMPVPLGSSQPRRRGKLPKATTEYLKDWLHKHSDHPYPTEDEKKRLCAVTGLSMSQVSNWMINARRRILAPARANATPATTTTPYGAAPQQPFQGPPRPASGDSSATSRSGDMLYSQPAQYAQTLPPLPQPGSLGGSPPHRSSWPSSQQQSHSPPHASQYYNQGPPPLGPPTDGTASRGSPHSTHSDHILPPVSSLPALPVAATNGSSTDSQ